MGIETLVFTGAKWLWDKYSKDIIELTTNELKKKWEEFEWQSAEQKYCKRVAEQYSTTRLLGYPKPVSIEGIFTDVYILDNLSAIRRYDIEQLQHNKAESNSIQLNSKRIPIVNLLQKTPLLFILGKPGCGKTTLLKYLAISAIKPDKMLNEEYTPVFISLKEWSDTNLSIMEFFVKQFEICEFPNAEAFSEQLLKNGNALILLDGLDEVGQISKQNDFIPQLKTLYHKYPKCKIIVTCRIAAIDYFFDQFTYVEIADFDGNQIKSFTEKWYQDDIKKKEIFQYEIAKPENSGLRELAQTPLLLALLCLTFDETMSIPRRRVELYKEALDALLRKWDSSRGIRRDEIYHNLPPRRKEQLLSQIATENFVNQDFFIKRDVLVQQISKYINRLPPTELKQLPLDSEAILKAIENQHGLLVERARGIYSFSHLTFQEYLVAKYIVDNAGSGTIIDLFDYLNDSQWNEIFLLVSSLLDDADIFFELFSRVIFRIVKQDKEIETLVNWIKKIAIQSQEEETIARTVALFVSLVICRRGLITDGKTKDIENIKSLNFALKLSADLLNRITPINRPYIYTIKSLFNDITGTDVDKVLDPKVIITLAKQLGVKIYNTDLNLRVHNVSEVIRYLQLNLLLLDCLQLASVSSRDNVMSQLLFLPNDDSFIMSNAT